MSEQIRRPCCGTTATWFPRGAAAVHVPHRRSCPQNQRPKETR